MKIFKLLMLALTATMVNGLWSTVNAQPQESDDDATYWYRIVCTMPNSGSYAMTDCSNLDDVCQLQMLATNETEEKSQWKIVKHSQNQGVVLINRATGNMIDAKSFELDSLNATQLTTEEPQNPFHIEKLTGETPSFSIWSIENDDNQRCLAMIDRNGGPLAYPSSATFGTPIAWQFTLIEEEITGLSSQQDTPTSIRVANHRIAVKGAKRWQLFNALGEEMPQTTDLPAGAYIVKIGAKKVKVMVK